MATTSSAKSGTTTTEAGAAPTTGARAGAAQRGRPRAFDREAALEQALRLFWERGYEVTSVADLTAVMGIRPPSLYAAFGDKRALFDEVVARYRESHGAYSARALAEEPTARAGVARMLREAAAEATDPDHPWGCLLISSTVNCTSPEVVEAVRALRNANVRALESLIRADVAAGHEPAGADPAALAQFTATVVQGMSQRARDGATRAELERVAADAMRVWP
ncbi:TetR/AcrR family transcriptional regulator [Streptomyces sp. BE20]|uniref:TetR/AcrR family transcriptional regulator n=1 Tax=Streptomyces sp. BE20 TaxID=3002525 RepID=UPI002E7A1713|nr:TetR/AcrR family transcriptional regulator [Streptomyces sp. BE20]MEE1827066.1 TetR/AcrR family transcriptional regulator [Streptomyces sp. BE20]